MLSVALTGNVGCGKSTVAEAFRSLGAEVLDADAIVHELLAEDGDAVGPVLASFPEAARERAVDRKTLGAIVFGDAERRTELERILHPLVVEQTRERLEELARSGASIVVTEVPLLFEAADSGSAGAGSLERFDRVIVVTCDAEQQVARLVARAGGDADTAEAEARRRIAAQLPQREKAARADWVIDNSGGRAETERQVRVISSALHRLLLDDDRHRERHPERHRD